MADPKMLDALLLALREAAGIADKLAYVDLYHELMNMVDDAEEARAAAGA